MRRGALAAALLPIALGIVAIVAALGLTAIVGQAMDLTFSVTNMITMMGLAVGIDYSLFILTRFREERNKGLGKLDAIAGTGATQIRQSSSAASQSYWRSPGWSSSR